MQIHRDLERLPHWTRPVITIGSFDGVHHGHRTILAQLNAEAAQVQGESVLVTFEPHPRLILAPRTQGAKAFQLIHTLEEKLTLLATTGLHHVVVVPFDQAFSSMSAERYLHDFIWARFRPHTILIGYDHRFGNDRSGDIHTLRNWAKDCDVRVNEIQAQTIDHLTVSSTRIRAAVAEGDMTLATQLLGAPFPIGGEVVHGDHLGRTIGSPTANLSIADAHKILPPDGIYACTAQHQGRTLIGSLYIGYRPTLAGATERRVEVFFHDFDGDLYGQHLQLDVHKRIRGDMQLSGLEALKTQIQADNQAVKASFGAFSAPSAQQEQVNKRANVAIVMLNYNTVGHLATFLPSVKEHSQGARIIVADNGSPDNSVAYLRDTHPEVEVLDLGTNYGFAGGYNEALRQVNAEIYVILNSDVEVTAGWLDAPLALLANDPTVAIVQPKIKAYRQKTHFEYAGAAGGWIDVLGYPFCRGRIFSHTEADGGQHDTEHECFWAAGAAFFIRAELYHAFEGFDADYFAHNEEIDLCWRVKRAGYRVVCTPASVVYHLGGGTLEYESPRKVFLNFRNSLFTLLKNGTPTTLLWVIPMRLCLDGLAGVRFLLKGQFRAIWSIVEAHFSFYGQFIATLRKRTRINALLQKHGIGAPNLTGMTQYSVVWRFYAMGKKVFQKK